MKITSELNTLYGINRIRFCGRSMNLKACNRNYKKQAWRERKKNLKTKKKRLVGQ